MELNKKEEERINKQAILIWLNSLVKLRLINTRAEKPNNRFNIVNELAIDFFKIKPIFCII